MREGKIWAERKRTVEKRREVKGLQCFSTVMTDLETSPTDEVRDSLVDIANRQSHNPVFSCVLEAFHPLHSQSFIESCAHCPGSH